MGLVRATAGNVVIVFALLLPVLIGMFGLAFDIAALRFNRSQLQIAADAGALAGVDSLPNQATAQQMAEQIAQANAPQAATGIVNDNDVQIGVYNTATRSFQATAQSPNAVYVHAARDLQHDNILHTIFAQALGWTSQNPVSASAIAMTGQAICHYILDPSSFGALQLGGGVAMRSNCGMQVDSNSAAAVTTIGVFDVNISRTCVVGGISSFGFGTYSPTPTTGCATRPDPLQGLQEPTGSASCQRFLLPVVNQTLNPGCYSGLITIAGGVTLNPGLYQFQNAQVVLLAVGSVNGSGVTLYFDGQSTFTMAALASIQISAPASGTYQGISIFYSRSANQYAFNILGGGTLSINGAIYAPSTNLSLTGVGASSGNFGFLICNRLVATGLWTINLGGFGTGAKTPNAIVVRAELVQ